MTTRFPKVRLGSFLKHRKKFFTLDDTARYKRVRVQLHNQGVVLRDTVKGEELRTKKQHAVRTGDLLVAEIDAKVGGFGIVPAELDGAIVSSHYFLYEIDETKCLRGWLDAFIRSGGLEDQVKARGTTNYAAIRPEHVLDFEIPLPPVDEQRGIMARIEEVAARIEEARGLRRQAADGFESLLSSVLKHFPEPVDGWQTKLISNCSTMSTGTTPPSHRDDYYGGDLQWYTPGDLGFSKRLGRSSRTVSDRAVAEGKVRLFESGTLLLVAIGASLGKVGLAQMRCSSNQQITGLKFSPEILPEYGFWWMRRLYKDLRVAAPQATLPIINQRRIGEFEIAIPPIDVQRRIVAYLDDLQTKVDALKQLQAETAAELDALLPSVLDKAFKGEL